MLLFKPHCHVKAATFCVLLEASQRLPLLPQASTVTPGAGAVLHTIVGTGVGGAGVGGMSEIVLESILVFVEVCEGVRFKLLVMLTSRLRVALAVLSNEGLLLSVVCVFVSVGIKDALIEAIGLPVCELLGVCEGLVVLLAEDTLLVCVFVSVGIKDALIEAIGLPVRELLGVCEGLVVLLADKLGVFVKICVWLRVCVVEGLA